MRSTWKVKKPFGPIFKSSTILFLVAAASLVGVIIWFNASLAPPSDLDEKKTFVIERGESPNSIIERLREGNLIKNVVAFRIYMKVSGLDIKIQAGSYELSTNLAAPDLAELLTKGRFDKKLTLIEGLRKEEVAEILEKESSINKEEFLRRAKEGYIFPDTYLVPNNVTLDQLLQIVEDNFNKKVTERTIESARKNGISKEQLLILASIVEREARDNEQRGVIAGILIKRWQSGVPLGADATIQYALGYRSEEKTWWRKNLTVEDLEINSKYNTRKNVGLPPGPICNPGISSIEAVANPKDTPYQFYLHDQKGVVHYAKTLEEHEQNIPRYLN